MDGSTEYSDFLSMKCHSESTQLSSTVPRTCALIRQVVDWKSDANATHPLDVFLHVVAIQIGCFCVCGAVRALVEAPKAKRMIGCTPVRVWIVQQTLYARQDGGNVVRRTPSILQDIEAEFAIGVDVWVKHP